MSRIIRKKVCNPKGMKSASKGGIPKRSLQVPRVALLGTGHMAQPGIDRYERGFAIREIAHRPCAAKLPVQMLNHIVDADTHLVLRGGSQSGSEFPKCQP